MGKNQQTLAIAQQLDISTNMSIDKDDIVAIAVSRFEDMLLDAKKAAEDKIKDISKSQTATAKQLDSMIDVKGKEIGNARTKEITQALSSVYPGIDADEVGTSLSWDGNKGTISVSVSLSYKLKPNKSDIKKGVGVLEKVLSIKETVGIKFTEEITKVHDQIAKLNEEKDAMNANLFDIRAKLADISRVERQAKAAVVKATLNGDLTTTNDILKTLEKIGSMKQASNLIELVGTSSK